MSEENPKELWKRYVAAAREYHSAKRDLYQVIHRYNGPGLPDTDAILLLLREALAGHEEERQDALLAASFLPLVYRQALFHELVSAALRWEVNNGLNVAAHLLAGLPADWVRVHFRPLVDRLLLNDPMCLRTNLLELCEALDPDLGLRLAKHALTSNDAYLQDIGAHFTKRFTDGP